MAETKEEKRPKVLNLDDFIKQSKKLFGADSVINAEKKEAYKDVIPTTPFSLRNALGIGGFAKGKIYTIDGEPSSGKSTTAYDVIGNEQKTYGTQCLLIDKEDSFTSQYGKLLGIDNSKLTIVSPHTLEDMYEAIIMGLESNAFGVIVVDSVTSFAPEARFEGSVVMGIEARVNSDKMRLVADAIQKSNTCLILIQQVRSKIGAMGDPTTVSGGVAIPFYAHVRIRITRSEIDRENQQNVMKFTVIKNKMAAPFKVGTVVYKWDEGFDFFSEVAELAVEFGIIQNEKGKKTYVFPECDVIITKGKKAAIQYLKDNPEYTKQVIEPKVREYLSSSQLRMDEVDEADLG